MACNVDQSWRFSCCSAALILPRLFRNNEHFNPTGNDLIGDEIDIGETWILGMNGSCAKLIFFFNINDSFDHIKTSSICSEARKRKSAQKQNTKLTIRHNLELEIICCAHSSRKRQWLWCRAIHTAHTSSIYRYIVAAQLFLLHRKTSLTIV